MSTPELMTKQEIHDFGVQIVLGTLKKDGYEVTSVDTELGMNPQIAAKKDGRLAFIVVRTECYPHEGELASETAMALIAHADKHRATCYFAAVTIVNGAAKSKKEWGIPVKGAPFYANYKGLVILTRSDRVMRKEYEITTRKVSIDNIPAMASSAFNVANCKRHCIRQLYTVWCFWGKNRLNSAKAESQKTPIK